MADVLGLRAGRLHACAWTVALTLVALLAALAGVAIGPTVVAPSDVAAILAHGLTGARLPDGLDTVYTVVWEVRLPRILLGLIVGAALGVAGVVLQAIVSNPLADPYILGINSGASTGAALAILFGAGASLFGAVALPTLAFAGAAAASAIMLALAGRRGRLSSTRLLLGGVAVGYALSAVTSLLVFASDNAQGARSVMFWLLGSLALARFGPLLWVTLGVVTACALALWLLARRIDALTTGDDAARTLGVHPDRTRLAVVLISCLLVGAVVAVAGSIGFVGLVVPHLARRLVGGLSAHVIPVAAALGAALLVVADIASRTLMAPQEIPLGVLTAIVGAPLLVVLVRRMGDAA